MKNFRTLLGLTAMVLLPMAAQADMKAMSLDELSAVEAQGRYSLSAGSISLYTFDTAVLAATPASGVYQLVSTKKPNLVPTVRDRGLTVVNDVVLPPVNAAVRTTLISSIPIFGSTVADMVTPIGISFTP
ncbi:MAG: hypothetical protein WBN85_03640 [Candidatus Macondimonas sp.]